MVPRRFGAVLTLVAVLGCGENSPSQDSSTGGVGNASGSSAGANGTKGGTGPGGSAGRTATGGVAPGAGGGLFGGVGGAATGAGASSAMSGGGALAAGGAAGTSAEGGGRAGSPGASGRGGAAGSGGAVNAGAGGKSGSAGDGGAPATGKCGPVTAVPEAVRTRLDLDAFYKKHVDANGLSVIASDEPADESLILACEALNNMLSKRDDVREELIRRKARFAIIGKSEGTAEIPEYGYRDRPQEDIDYINQRARGLGGIVASCGEENILCLKGDRYPRESICVHEFSHTITTYGAYTADRTFQSTLQAAYDSAKSSGILDDTYRKENLQEYWAEGVQDWYNTNDFSNPPNGVHNNVNTRAELADYDPKLYALVATMFPEAVVWGDCHVD